MWSHCWRHATGPSSTLMCLASISPTSLAPSKRLEVLLPARILLLFQANIHAILDCEVPVNTLLESIDGALLALDNLDEYVTAYVDMTKACDVM